VKQNFFWVVCLIHETSEDRFRRRKKEAEDKNRKKNKEFYPNWFIHSFFDLKSI
jgi:hypothetical protein